ncbi:MAG: RICIN domain-containing protein, partial [Bacteroidaceae bacterium]|nr:RICIN domain-containing protein [Bacteroidaceae bacterium]
MLSGQNEPVKLSNFVVRVKHFTSDEVAQNKEEAKTAAAANAANLGNGIGYYSYTANGTKLYTLDDVNAAIEACETLEAITAITESYSVNLPEAGKMYRFGYNYGNETGVLYLQSTNSSVKGLEMAAGQGEGSIFLVEEIDGNLRLKSISTGKYLKEDGNHRGLYDEGNNVTFKAGAALGQIKIQATSYLHANTSNGNYFVDHCGGDGCAQHNFVAVEVISKQLTVTGDAKVKATATWNNETKPLPATWVILGDFAIENPTLTINTEAAYEVSGIFEGETDKGTTVNIEDLDGDVSLVVKFVPAFFSQNVGDKWINIVRKTDAGHAMFLGSNVADAKPTFNKKDYTNTGMLWSFVGTADNFKIYNYVSGEALALTPSAASIGDGTEVKMVAAADAQSWHLIEKDGGYAIVPVGNNDWSLNSYGGTNSLGANIKFYGANDGGSHWNFDLIDVENTLSMAVYVDQVLESSPRVAELTFSIDGSTAQTRIEGNVEATTYYLPKGATLSLSSMTYRGYDFGGFDFWADGELSAEAFCIPEGGPWVYAYYTANDERTLFYSPRDGHPYRIPAIATAPNGDIFAICDYRPCGNDIGYGEVDLVCRVSSDNGVTWTQERTIADGLGHINDGIWKMGFGDPAIVADRESNKVLVMSVCGNRTCWDGNYGEENANPNRVSRLYITYDEEKKEWVYGAPEEVTESIYPKFVDKDGNVHAASLFIGAGKICQSRVVKKGDYYRLYCAVWNVTKTQRQHHNYVIYSDDFGQTWNVLGDLGYENCASKWGNEPKVEELPDGTVVLSSRKYNGRYFNLFTFADETYTTGSWMGEVGSNEVENGLSFGGNSTNGEIYKVKAVHKETGRICDLMFQSIPTGNDRSNVAIYYKEMEYNEDGTNKYTSTTFAQNWTKGKHVSTKGSCYSTMIMQADGRIGFFFEEEPSGYCMVYIPYSIEDLTGGLYEASAENKASFLLHAAPKVLALTGVGYPEEDSEVRNDLTKAIEAVNAGNASTEDYEALSDAYEAYITTTDVQMPADGGTYIIYSVLTTDENNFSPSFNVLKYDEQSGVLTVAQKSATDDDAEKFVCRVIDAENQLYAFVNAKNGKYTIYYSLIRSESVTGLPIAADNGKATGFSQSYNCMGKDEADLYLRSTADLRLGTFAISGKDANTKVYDYWSTLFVDNDQLDRHSGRSDLSNVYLVCEANASSVFAFQEVSYPNNVKLNT